MANKRIMEIIIGCLLIMIGGALINTSLIEFGVCFIAIGVNTLMKN